MQSSDLLQDVQEDQVITFNWLISCVYMINI